MESKSDGGFCDYVADSLTGRRKEIARGWVDRLSTRLGVRPRRVLPTRELLDHVPWLLERFAGYVREGEPPLATQPPVVEDLTALARLRWEEGCDVAEVLSEFELLGHSLDDFLLDCARTSPGEPRAEEVARAGGRLNRALQAVDHLTAAAFHEKGAEEHTFDGQLLGDFTEALAHQLKTPLGAAEGAALLLENEEMMEEAGERQRFAALVRRNIGRARTAIDDVREVALARTRRGVIGRPTPLPEVVSTVREELDPFAAERGVEIRMDTPVPDATVYGARTEIVLLNLLGNGVKYSDPEKSERWVRLGFQCREGTDEWWAYVRDNGLGVPAELQEHVFRRFFRAHPERAEGTGLGLSIAREALEQVGSRLDFESVPGVGTTFRFPLPSPPLAED